MIEPAAAWLGAAALAMGGLGILVALAVRAHRLERDVRRRIGQLGAARPEELGTGRAEERPVILARPGPGSRPEDAARTAAGKRMAA